MALVLSLTTTVEVLNWGPRGRWFLYYWCPLLVQGRDPRSSPVVFPRNPKIHSTPLSTNWTFSENLLGLTSHPAPKPFHDVRQILFLLKRKRCNSMPRTDRRSFHCVCLNIDTPKTHHNAFFSANILKQFAIHSLTTTAFGRWENLGLLLSRDYLLVI
jgi:hypothetical protein